jgi:cytochrome b561
VIAILIVIAWFTGEGAEVAMETIQDGGTVSFVPHVALGLSILLPVVVRRLVRFGRGAPAALGTPGSPLVLAADLGNRLISLLMLAVPLGGVSVFFLSLDVGRTTGSQPMR